MSPSLITILFVAIHIFVWFTLIWLLTDVNLVVEVRDATKNWLKEEPGNPARLTTIVIAILIVSWAFFSPQATLLYDLRYDAVSMAFTVIVLSELATYRARQEEKRRILEQMGSRVNDMALEAVRLAHKHGWLTDGSLNDLNLSSARLDDVDFRSARLQNAILRNAYLNRADLRCAHLEGAKLWYANLNDAYMQRAHLNGADFQHADLRNADLSGAEIEDAVFQGSLYNASTVWPFGFDPVVQGARLVESNVVDNRKPVLLILLSPDQPLPPHRAK